MFSPANTTTPVSNIRSVIEIPLGGKISRQGCYIWSVPINIRNIPKYFTLMPIGRGCEDPPRWKLTTAPKRKTI